MAWEASGDQLGPPFANYYIYSDSIRDMGNCRDEDEFFAHLDFLLPELLRITRPGRLCAVHCKDLVRYQNRDGQAGMYDFPGVLIQRCELAGWQYHSRVTIWKDPVTEMQRTKAHGLLYRTLKADATFTRQGMPDYLLVFRRWGGDEALHAPVTHDPASFPLDMWQRYASPVWFDIDPTDVLNAKLAREDRDERHICPLQLEVIRRAVELWSNPGDLVFSPFGGIGSEGYASLEKGRRFLGIELKERYWDQACGHLTALEAKTAQRDSLLQWGGGFPRSSSLTLTGTI